jgi:hypothetical protein
MSWKADYKSEKKDEQGASNAQRPSFFAHGSRAQNSVLALGERGSSLTLGKRDEDAPLH